MPVGRTKDNLIMIETQISTTDVINLIRSEIKKYSRQDIILSEREMLENKKIASILDDLIKKITLTTTEK